jgi:hypothetical protein
MVPFSIFFKAVESQTRLFLSFYFSFQYFGLNSGLVLTRQALYQPSPHPSFALLILELGSHVFMLGSIWTTILLFTLSL